jgi:hypothetical protein
VKIGIKNKLNRLIVGKPTRLVTPPPPVPAPNLAAMNCFLENDSEVEEEPIYQHLPEISVANDFCDFEDGLDNDTNCVNNEHDSDYQSQHAYLSDQTCDSDSHIEYCEIAGESQGDRGSWPRNCPTVDDLDDDGGYLSDEECQVREQLEEQEEVEEVEDRGEETDGVNGYE